MGSREEVPRLGSSSPSLFFRVFSEPRARKEASGGEVWWLFSGLSVDTGASWSGEWQYVRGLSPRRSCLEGWQGAPGAGLAVERAGWELGHRDARR